KTLYAGSEMNVQVKRQTEMRAPQEMPPTEATAQVPSNAAQSGQAAQLRFAPTSLSLKAGETATVGVVVDNVDDLFSIPFLMQYNPKMIRVEEVRHGGFLQAGDQEVAI